MTGTAGAAGDDPYLWLEEIDGARALDWVRAENARSLAVLEADPRFATIHAQARDIHTAKDRIPYGRAIDGLVHNFWRDEAHVRGLLRCAPLDEYRKASPDWRTVIDIDALAEAEGENWVYAGRDFLPGDPQRFMISLSRGGGDAVVLREYNGLAGGFVEGGFMLPEGKQTAAWVDADRLLVASEHGGGTLNTSGYPNRVRAWSRGAPFENAALVCEAPEDEAFLWPITLRRPEGTYHFVLRKPDGYSQILFLLDPDLNPVRLDVPQDSEFEGVLGGQMLLSLRSDWSVEGATLPAGGLVSLDLAHTAADGQARNARLVAPAPARGAIQGAAVAGDRLLIQMIDNVKGRIESATLEPDGWRTAPIDLPDLGSVNIVDADPMDGTAFVTFQDFLTPTTLYLVRGEAPPEPIKQMPAHTDTSPYAVDQHFATSKDGTEVPYFLLRSKDIPGDGTTPTLLYGYGGFEISLTPSYLGPAQKAWLEHGGAYAIANIRGGGEFGPAWHRAAMKQHRQRAFDDFYAVAEDLVARKVTTPARLGIYGGSNGGLLVGVAMTQRPELFGAVVCAVPLADMLRYHTLLAGASWIGEYGNPDVPEERAWIARYSPYQNVRSGDGPPVFFWTSTRDDRVHPGHARKMAAKLMEMGADVLYYENVEGGHSAAADLLQLARRDALTVVYMLQKLADAG